MPIILKIKDKMKQFKIWMLLALVALISVSFSSCTRVDSSEVGIKFNKLSLTDQGKLDASTVTGYIVYNPITTDVYTYPTYMRTVDYNVFKVKTKDGTVFEMDPVLNYNLERNYGVKVFSKFRRPLEEIENKYIRNAVWDAYRINANNYTADELMASQAKFESEVKAMLDTVLGTQGFHVEQFTSQIDPPESLRKIIDAKNAAVQAALKAENEVKEAEANAKIAVAKAEGDAKAMRVKADAEAYYNRTISASLSERIVQEDFLEKWDGKMPEYYMPGNNSSVFKILP